MNQQKMDEAIYNIFMGLKPDMPEGTTLNEATDMILDRSDHLNFDDCKNIDRAVKNVIKHLL